jgi:hypothetical protein
MDNNQIIILIIVILIELVAIGYLILLKKKIGISKAIDEADEKSAFSPTVFKIYDRSTVNKCDRLILIEPFDWYLWAIRDELYILNPESSNLQCGNGSTPVVQVFANHFLETCLNIDMITIIDKYTKNIDISPKHVPYTIDKQTFTIFSAINILVKDWITFNPYPIVYKDKMKLPTLKLAGGDDDDDDNDEIILGGRRNKREINSEQLQTIKNLRMQKNYMKPIIVMNDDTKDYSNFKDGLTKEQIDYSKVYKAISLLGGGGGGKRKSNKIEEI